LAYKVADLHREAATLRADRLALEAAKVKLQAETEAFKKSWETAEKQHHECAVLKDDAGKATLLYMCLAMCDFSLTTTKIFNSVTERQAAEKIYLEAKSIIATLDHEKQDVEKCRVAVS
jgi:hypothetical protein